MTPRQARNDFKAARKDAWAGTIRLNSRQQKTTKQARKDPKAGKKILKRSQEKTQNAFPGTVVL